MKIVITAPHTCLNIYDSGCDINSETYQAILGNILEDSILLSNKSTRYVCDNNRIECRKTPMRRALTRLLEKHGEDLFIIDVHSFPASDPFVEGSDITLLDTYLSNETVTVYEALEDEGYSVDIVEGIDNDIQNQAREYNAKAILLELADDIPVEIVEEIAYIIGDIVDNI
jgi:hypothetical protein